MNELRTLKLNNDNNFEMKLLKDLERQKKEVYEQYNRGIIESVDAVNEEIEMYTAKERKIKRGLVLKAHTTEDGKPRTIKYQESKKLWQTIMPDGKRLYGKTEEILMDKLFDYYHLTIQKPTIHNLFLVALDEKEKTEPVAEDTIYQYKYAYQRFISEELGKRDITTVTGTDLKEYTMNLVTSTDIITSAFKEYKGVLNLIFNYAIHNEIINSNPVACIDNKKYMKACVQVSKKPEDQILSEEEVKKVIAKVRKNMTHGRYKGYFINGYAILLAIETGMRAGELCSIKWSDVNTKDKTLHIHSQQLNNKRKGGKVYYYAPWTKDERGVSQGGRHFPLTDAIKDILDELKALQEENGIESEYIFCHRNGEWIKTDAYETCLRRLMKSLKLNVTNNHTFRKTLNCNVFIDKMHLSVAKRAMLLGHSIATNEKYYSFPSKDDDLSKLCEAFNKVAKEQVTPQSHLQVVRFDKEKTLESA